MRKMKAVKSKQNCARKIQECVLNTRNGFDKIEILKMLGEEEEKKEKREMKKS